MAEADNIHDPSTWQTDVLLTWLSLNIGYIATRIEENRGKAPCSSDLVVKILQLAKQDPSLCVAGHAQLVDKVVATFSPKRVAPVAVVEQVVANPAFAHQKHTHQQVGDDALSEVSVELEFHNPSLEDSYGFRPEQAYRNLWKSFREIKRKYTLGVHHQSGLRIDSLSSPVAPEDDVDDAVSEDGNLSDLSSTFWKEVEEDEEPTISHNPSVDYSAIVADEVDQLRQTWILRKLPKSQRTIGKLWTSYLTTSQRSIAAKIKLNSVKHLQKRLEKLQASIIDTAEGTVGMPEKAVRRQCASLEQTVFDHQRLMFEHSALTSIHPPDPVDDAIVRKERVPVESAEQDTHSVEDAISLDSSTASALNASPLAASCEISADLVIVDDEIPVGTELMMTEPLNEAGAQPTVEASSRDGNILTSETNTERERTSSADDPLNHNDDDLLATLASSINDTPKGKKRKAAFQQSVESKRHQLDALKRTEDYERRTLQYSQSLHQPGHIPINPGKTQDQEFVYINEKMCKALKQHQVDGVRFLWREILLEKDDNIATGCLLSHTMGLGKTVQIITLLLTIAEASQSESLRAMVPTSLHQSQTLIMCPSGLVSNWVAEFNKWLSPEDGELLGRIHVMDARSTSHQKVTAWARHGGILIVGYSLFRNIVQSPAEQTEQVRLLLNTATLVVADEAHSIKNVDSHIRRAADQLSTRRRIAMTGSPLSNNILEYWSTIDWVSKGYLGPLGEFKDMFEASIQAGSFMESTKVEEKAARIALMTLERVLQPKVHRRDATVLKEMLPPKREFIIKLSLTPVQHQLYSSYVQFLRQRRATDVGKGDVLHHGQALIWIANHPAIFSRHIAARHRRMQGRKTTTEDLTGLEMSDEKQLALQYNNEDIRHSAKTLYAIHLVQAAIAAGDKTLLFSHSLCTLDYLADQMAAHGIGFEKLTGETMIEGRTELLAKFNREDNGPKKWVLLVSTRTGNAGFNIYGANRVIIFDFNWNPTFEEQAVGRTYRLGQRKNVFIYRFVSEATFESALLSTTAGKTQLTAQVVEGKHTQNVLSRNDSRYIGIPDMTTPISPATLGHWYGQDPVLDNVLQLNFTQGAASFITDIIDGEVFRKERQPEPLDEEQTRSIEAWVTRFQRGDRLGPTTAEIFLQHAQMTELLPHRQPHHPHHPHHNRSTHHPLHPQHLPPHPDSRLAHPPIHDYRPRHAQSISTSPFQEMSVGRQDVRSMPQFNFVAQGGQAHASSPAPQSQHHRVAGLIATAKFPQGVECIDLTDEQESQPLVNHLGNAPATLLAHSQVTDASSPGRRAAQAVQQSVATMTATAAAAQVPAVQEIQSLGATENLEIRAYTGATSSDGNSNAPTWSDRNSTRQSAANGAEAMTATAGEIGSPIELVPYASGLRLPSNAELSLPAMSETGVPQLTEPRRRFFSKPQQPRQAVSRDGNASTGTSTLRHRPDSPEWPTDLEPNFMTSMFSELRNNSGFSVQE